MINEYKIKDDYAVFECGCKFKVDSYRPDGSPKIILRYDIEQPEHDIIWDCRATYDLLSTGFTNGVFQLESNLGKAYAKKLRPTEINDMINLVSLLRPGCLNSTTDDGTSMTDLYCLRKNGEREVEYKYDVLKPILSSTWGVIVMQEQSIKIAQLIAGFNALEGEKLRSAISKKKTDVMHQLKSIFIEKATRLGIVTEDGAKEIFSWIEESQRYSFTRGHASPYGRTGYIIAYQKAHFPLQLFLMKLRGAREEQHSLEEIDRFVEDAKLFNINVLPPDLRKMNETFWSDRKDIYFGLTDIKGIGQSQFKKLREMPTGRWIDFLLSSNKISSTVMDALIRSGALSHFGLSRKRMLEEYRVYQAATKSVVSSRIIEKIIAEDPKDNLMDLLDAVLPLLPKKKDYNNSELYEKINSDLKLLKNPPSSLEDTHGQIVAWELELLGVAVSQGRIKMSDESLANCNIKDLLTGIVRSPIIVAQILSVKMLVTKRGSNPGQRMASVILEDNSGKISCPVFPAEFEKYESLIVTGSTLAFSLDRLRDGGYNIKKIWEL